VSAQQEAEHASAPEERRERRIRLGRRWVVAGIALVVAITYVVVVLLYAAGARIVDREITPDSEGAVEVVLSPLAINGPTERISLDVSVDAPPSMVRENGVEMNTDLVVVVTPVDGTQSITLPKGSVPKITKTTSVLAEGAVENWPFDHYGATIAVIAYTSDDGETNGIPVHIEWKGNLSGWDFAATDRSALSDDTLDLADGTQVPVPLVGLEASRSGSTLAFGFVLLGLLVVMPALVLFVAISAYTGRRKVEATLMSWMGAMLFATLPLRTFLPGSPPIGSWIDFLIVLWVIVGLVMGLAVYVAAWNRWGSRSPGGSTTVGGRFSR
jgi:hypothetical protein